MIKMSGIAPLSAVCLIALAAAGTPARAQGWAYTNAQAIAQFTCTGTVTDQPPGTVSFTGVATSSAAVLNSACSTGESSGGGATASADLRGGSLSASASALYWGGASANAGLALIHADIRNPTNMPHTYAWIAVINGSADPGQRGTASGSFYSSEMGYLAGHPDELTNSWGLTDGAVILIPHVVNAFSVVSLDLDYQLSAGANWGGTANYAHTATLFLQLPEELVWERDASGAFLADRTDAILRPDDPIPTGVVPEPSIFALLAGGALALIPRRRFLKAQAAVS